MSAEKYIAMSGDAQMQKNENNASAESAEALKNTMPVSRRV
jgi:hypothetical protein